MPSHVTVNDTRTETSYTFAEIREILKLPAPVLAAYSVHGGSVVFVQASRAQPDSG